LSEKQQVDISDFQHGKRFKPSTRSNHFTFSGYTQDQAEHSFNRQ